jgi:hypothetical protein
MIYVTEPFSRSKAVKLDDPSRDPADAFDALKLNLVRDFQTGIYDYNTMTSVFVHSDTFEPAKISFSSAEWCGHVYDEIRFEGNAVHEWIASYFEGESGTRDLPRPPDGIVEDNLFIRLRGLRGPFLSPGASRTAPFLPGAFTSRLTHRRPEWTTVTVERDEKTESVTVPAGRFAVDVYRVTTGEGRTGRFDIEVDYPHRIVRWSWTGGDGTGITETGELTGTARLRYWELQGNGDETRRNALGLDPVR